MVHTCAKCGKVYPDSSPEILRGCSACGGRKFYFERAEAAHRKHDHKPRAAPEPHVEHEGAPEESSPDDPHDRVESIRILGPGTYELNIEKMARSDDRVVGLGKEGSYAVDLLSMAGKKKKS